MPQSSKRPPKKRSIRDIVDADTTDEDELAEVISVQSSSPSSFCSSRSSATSSEESTLDSSSSPTFPIDSQASSLSVLTASPRLGTQIMSSEKMRRGKDASASSAGPAKKRRVMDSLATVGATPSFQLKKAPSARQRSKENVRNIESVDPTVAAEVEHLHCGLPAQPVFGAGPSEVQVVNSASSSAPPTTSNERQQVHQSVYAGTQVKESVKTSKDCWELTAAKTSKQIAPPAVSQDATQSVRRPSSVTGETLDVNHGKPPSDVTNKDPKVGASPSNTSVKAVPGAKETAKKKPPTKKSSTPAKAKKKKKSASPKTITVAPKETQAGARASDSSAVGASKQNTGSVSASSKASNEKAVPSTKTATAPSAAKARPSSAAIAPQLQPMQVPPSKSKRSSAAKPQATSVETLKAKGATPMKSDGGIVKPPARASSASEPSQPVAVKKMTFQDKIFHHMLVSFKPFTLKTLADGLKEACSSVDYCLMTLVDKGLVIKKEFTAKGGRTTTLFWANHGAKSKEVTVSLATSSERETAKRELAAIKAKNDSIQSILQGVLREPSNEELAFKLSQQEEELAETLERVNAVKARIQSSKMSATSSKGGLLRGPPKSATQLAKERCPRRLKMRINHMRSEWVKRKNKCMDFVDQLADGMEKKPKEVVKILDLDTDEAEGAVMPPKYVIEQKKL